MKINNNAIQGLQQTTKSKTTPNTESYTVDKKSLSQTSSNKPEPQVIISEIQEDIEAIKKPIYLREYLFALLLSLSVHTGLLSFLNSQSKHQETELSSKKTEPTESSESLNNKKFIPSNIKSLFSTEEAKIKLSQKLQEKNSLSIEEFRNTLKEIYQENPDDFFKNLNYGNFFIFEEYFQTKEINQPQVIETIERLNKTLQKINTEPNIKSFIISKQGRYHPGARTLTGLFIDFMNLDNDNLYEDLAGNCEARYKLEAAILQKALPGTQTYVLLSGPSEYSPAGHIQLAIKNKDKYLSYTPDNVSADDPAIYTTEELILSSLGVELNSSPNGGPTIQSKVKNPNKEVTKVNSISSRLKSGGSVKSTSPSRPQPIIKNKIQSKQTNSNIPTNPNQSLINQQKKSNNTNPHQPNAKNKTIGQLLNESKNTKISKSIREVFNYPQTTSLKRTILLSYGNENLYGGSVYDFHVQGMYVDHNKTINKIPEWLNRIAKQELKKTINDVNNFIGSTHLGLEFITSDHLKENMPKKSIAKKIYYKLKPNLQAEVLKAYPELKTDPEIIIQEYSTNTFRLYDIPQQDLIKTLLLLKESEEWYHCNFILDKQRYELIQKEITSQKLKDEITDKSNYHPKDKVFDPTKRTYTKTNLTNKHLEQAINKISTLGNKDHRISLFLVLHQTKKFSTEQIDRFINDLESKTKTKAEKAKIQITKLYLNHKSVKSLNKYQLAIEAFKHYDIESTPSLSKIYITTKDNSLIEAALQNPNTYHWLIQNPNLTTSQIDTLILNTTGVSAEHMLDLILKQPAVSVKILISIASQNKYPMLKYKAIKLLFPHIQELNYDKSFILK